MSFCPDMEPMIPSDNAIEGSALPELALELERRSARLAGQIAPATADTIEAHMRVINSYYSNLIEGNRTHPRDIRRAMAGDYSEDPAKRDLQLESVAHIDVQRQLAAQPIAPHALTAASTLSHLHALFYGQLPETLRQVHTPSGDRTLKVTPGVFRKKGEEVAVGQHLPPPGDKLPDYLARFEQAYRLDRLQGQKRVIAAMAAHHRLAWIHPFPDGNGRVTRLHTDAFLKAIGLGACGVWSLSRGLARNSIEYKARLARADESRRGDRDGRGALSESGLVDFVDYMLRTALDQVNYMDTLLNLTGMMQRIRTYVLRRGDGLIPGMAPLRSEAGRILERAFLTGELQRQEAYEVSGLSESVTRKLLQQLKEEGLLVETTHRSPLRWAIPEHAESYYFPELTPA